MGESIFIARPCLPVPPPVRCVLATFFQKIVAKTQRAGGGIYFYRATPFERSDVVISFGSTQRAATISKTCAHFNHISTLRFGGFFRGILPQRSVPLRLALSKPQKPWSQKNVFVFGGPPPRGTSSLAHKWATQKLFKSHHLEGRTLLPYRFARTIGKIET